MKKAVYFSYSLVRQLNSWVWPGTVAEAAQELRLQPKLARETVTLWLWSPFLRDGWEGGYDYIIKECLETFTLSPGLLDLAHDLYGSYMSDEADRVLRGLRFSGSVEFLDDSSVDEAGSRKIARLKLLTYEFRVLSKPLEMLTELVGVKCMYWRDLAVGMEPGEVRHLDSPSQWSLPVWIDAVVGRHFGFETLGQYGFTLDDRYHQGGYDAAPAYFGPVPVSGGARRRLEIFMVPQPHRLDPPKVDASGVLDGFRRLERTELEEGLTLNLRPHLNTFSPFSRVDRVPESSEESLVVDENYGLIYNAWFHRAPGLYGLTEALPVGPLDHLATYGFLRTPFRRIPRIAVESIQQVRGVVANIRETCAKRTLVFRGQNHEYTIPRDGRTRLALFGDEQAQEPSIIASAVRKTVSVTGLMPEWCGLVNTTLRGLLDALLRSPEFRADEKQLRSHYAGLSTNYVFSQFSLALAQHYGLPSNGVDTTTSNETALSFALHCFTPSSVSANRLNVERHTSWDDPPVLYVLAIPSEQYEIRFNYVAPLFAKRSRPEAQDACFIHSGWGCSKNDATRWLVAAFYIMKPLSFDDLPNPETLFPSRNTDILGHFLQTTADGVSRSESLRYYLDRLYWLA